MKDISSDFKIAYDDTEINIMEHSVGAVPIYRITFADERKPLIITVTANLSKNNYWTSVPQGRQKEAEEIGLLITEVRKNK